MHSELSDPFLDAHQTGPATFWVGTNATHASVRDQMVRGALFVRRAVEVGMLRAGKSILVVGAGVGGATIAIASAEAGAKTLLIERAKRAFPRQAGCRTRIVEPTLYDWPVAHWDRHTFPWEPPDVPLGPWSRGQAASLVPSWDKRLYDAVTRNPRLTFRTGEWIEAEPILDPASQKVRATVHRQQPGAGGRGTSIQQFNELYDLVAICVGRSEEKTSIGSYCGFKFWQNDLFGEPNWGVPAGDEARVVILGGGDGALQDYLRLLTGRTAFEILDAIRPEPRLALELQALEDQTQRAFALSDQSRWGHDHRTHHWLQGKVRDLVSRWLPGLGDRLKSLLSRRPASLKLVHWCTHFDRCYGLNRFLVLLVSEYLEASEREATIIPGAACNTVMGIGHRCDAVADELLRAETCHGKQHHVTLSTREECRPAAYGAPLRSLDCNILIVRHGTNPLGFQNPSTGRPAPQVRHLLPYHVPH